MIRVEKFDFGHYGYFAGYDGWHSHIANNVGGVSVKYTVKNYGEKIVKKYTIYFKAYNGADEIVDCTVRGQSIVSVSDADGVMPYDDFGYDGLLENAWYNASIRYIEIDHIDVVYDDNTTESCVGNYVLTKEEEEEERRRVRFQKDMEREKSIRESLQAIVIIIILFILYHLFF